MGTFAAPALCAADPSRVCLEIAKGPLVYALQKYDFLVLFPVNPATLAKYREAFTPSRAKDDPTDAELALELLLRHRDQAQPLKPQSAAMRTLLQLVEQRRRLVGDKTRISNRLTDALKQYFPASPRLVSRTSDTLLFCDFLQSLADAQTAPARSQGHAADVLRCTQRALPSAHRAAPCMPSRAATPLTEDRAVITPHQLLVLALVEQLRVTLQAIERFDAEIATVSQTLPGLCAVSRAARCRRHPRPPFARRLRRTTRTLCQRRRAPEVRRHRAGHRSSGKKRWVHWRLQCPTFLRQTFVEWAGATIPRSFWAAAYYRQQRDKGCSHQAAVRALAFKWIRILYRCWQTRTPYDESTYLNALRRRGSPLLNSIAATAKTT